MIKNSHDKHEQLTRFPEGSARELWAIAFPLMLTALSGYLMMFFDRLILAYYSTDAMNGAATAGMVCTVFAYGAVNVSSIAEVFVGQYNGSKQREKMGIPAWQMIWFSLMTYVIFIPLAIWGAPYLLAEQYLEIATSYYQWLMLASPFLAVFSALAAFFIGKGKPRLVLITTITGNVVNLILNFLLVFGIKGLIPPMGATGAAIATAISQLLMVFILLFPFLNSMNRKIYGTAKFAFNLDAFWKCLKIGTPNAIGTMIEFAAWALIFNMLADLGKIHISVWTITNSVFIAFAFINGGMSKGIIAVAANLIGAKKPELVRKMIYSAVRLIIVMAVIISIPMIIFPDFLINAFLPEDIVTLRFTEVHKFVRIGLIGMWIFFIFDSLTWIFAGLFTAAGDTKFTMIMNAIAAWLFAITPIYFLVVRGHGNPSLTCFLVAVYAMLNCFAFFLRYRTHKWKSKRVIHSAEEIVEA